MLFKECDIYYSNSVKQRTYRERVTDVFGVKEREQMSFNTIEQDELLARERQKRYRRKKTWSSIFVLLGCLVLFTVLMGGIVAMYVWVDESLKENLTTAIELDQQSDAEKEAQANGEIAITYTQSQIEELIVAAIAEGELKGEEDTLQALKNALTQEKTMVEALRPLYKNELVVVSGGKFNFVPINESLKKNTYSESNLTIHDTGVYDYVLEDGTNAKKGIDVSKHQGKIDWKKVAADGVEFAFIRVGLRGYGTGEVVADSQFEANVKGAMQNGIKVGVYFFSQAINEQEAIEEATFVLDAIAPYDIELPIVIDVEKVSDSEARMNQISVQQRTLNTIAFCDTIAQKGYKPMIYHNMEMAALMLDMTALEDYEKWFAYYNGDMYYPYEYKVWQYSESGRVNGISGKVDLNLWLSE